MSQRLSDPAVLLSILDNLPTSIFVKDEDLRFVYSNAVHCRIIGKTEEELLGKSDGDFYSVVDAQGFREHDQSVIDTGETSIAEEMASSESGMTTPVLTRKARLHGPDGKTYLIGTNADLSDLRRRENQYRVLSETVPVGVAQVDENLDVHFSNPLFNVYCGGDGSEVDRLRLLKRLQEVYPGFPGMACKFETEIQGLGDQPRDVIIISSGWLDLGDALHTATVSIVDISQMAELQRINREVSRLNAELAANVKKLAEAQDELVRRGRMEQLGQLTATVAHELRNPLGAVRTSAFLLERKLKDKGLGIEAQLERINKGIVRCDNIITQLLDFSRNKQLICQPADLDHWLTGIVDEEARKLPSTISVELVLGLDGRTVPFDPSRLHRAVINLLSNAAEAMLSADGTAVKPGEEPRLVVSTYFKDEHVSLRVTDNGPGIPDTVMERIREPLFTTKSFGTGLGVPAIEQIAVQHGGRLDIESDIGNGSTFTMWLPVVACGSETQAA